MYTYNQAKESVLRYINRLKKHIPEELDLECAIIEEQTIEKPYGWVFFYQSKQYLESDDIRGLLVGNSPILFEKDTGKMIGTGTGKDINYYLDLYEKGEWNFYIN